MDSTSRSTGNAPETPELPGDPVSDAVKSALDDPPFQNAAAQAESLSGPAVLAQPPAGETGVPVAQSAAEERYQTAKPGPTPEVARGGFASAQETLRTGYRSVSSSTEQFAHESPWKAVAFAVLGGVIVGMLIAR